MSAVETFEKTPKQKEAIDLLSSRMIKFIALFGGS
jgi:hypothetical protein